MEAEELCNLFLLLLLGSHLALVNMDWSIFTPLPPVNSLYFTSWASCFRLISQTVPQSPQLVSSARLLRSSPQVACLCLQQSLIMMI